MNEYYVYAYLDPRKPGIFKYGDYCFEYEPFYIGKGTKSRLLRHLKDVSRNPIKINKINKIKSEGLLPKIIKIIDNISNVESLEIEKNLIRIIGRSCKYEGPLTNYSDGGETYIGYKHKKEYIDKLNKPVIKYNLNGDILDEYSSVKEAGEKNKIYPQTISQICSGNIKIYKNMYIFLYKGDIFKNRIRGKKAYPVIRLGYDGINKKYDSASDAAIDNKTTVTRIASVCVGERFKTCGYIFRYIDHPDLSNINKIISDKYGDILSNIDLELSYNGEKFSNILELIFKLKRPNLANIIYKKISKFNEFKTSKGIF